LRLALSLVAPASCLAAYVTSVVPPGQSTANPANFVGRTINVMDFGAQCDAVSGNGSMTAGSNSFTANGSSFSFNNAMNKPIVVSGAGNWTLNGYVTGSSNVIFNVQYVDPNGMLHPSLVGAAGYANISDSAGYIVTSPVPSLIATGYFGTPETGTISTTGTTSTTTSTITVATTTPQLIGQNGQAVFDASNSPVNIAVLYGMPVSSSSGDIPAGTTVAGTGTNTITLSATPMGNNTNETIYIGGNIIKMTLTAVGTSTSDTLSIPGAPLAGFISGVSGSHNQTVTITKTIGGSAANAAATVPTYVATRMAGFVSMGSGGSGFSPGDFLYINDGSGSAPNTALQVVAVSGGAIKPGGANVYSQAPQNGTRASYSQAGSSSGGGMGATGLQINYSSTGQFWYGTDDTAAINQALSAGVSLPSVAVMSVSGNIITLTTPPPTGIVVGMFVSGTGIPSNSTVTGFSFAFDTITVSQAGTVAPGASLTIAGPPALPQGSDIWLPANRNCGVASSINLPNGNNSLRGWDRHSSQIVALGQMPVDAGGVSYVVGHPPGVGPGGGGMRDLQVEGNKLAQYSCAVEQGENMFYQHVDCEDGVLAEWVCGYPGSVAGLNTSQITGTVFDHIQGATNGYPISLKPAENYLAANTCAAEEVVNSYFIGGWINILDSQGSYNLYDGNIEDSIEPFNAQYCVEITGRQTVSNNRCDDASSAGVFVAGNDAIVHDVTSTWNNAWPWLAEPWGGSYGAILAPGVKGDLVDGVNTASPASNAQIVLQQGAADPSTIVIDNPGATYSAPSPPSANPQGRLTFTSGVPVMAGGSSTPYSTMYYAPYTGNLVPIDVSGNLQYVPFTGASNPAGLAHVFDSNSSDTNYVQAAHMYDEFVGLNTGFPTLCNGPAWSSATTRGTSAALELLNGVLVNQMPIACNDNNAVVGTGPTFACPQDQCTYLGSFYASGNGQVTFYPQPAAASGGANAIVGFWNAYNRVRLSPLEYDSASVYHASGTGWEVADTTNSGKNTIQVVDGLQSESFDISFSQTLINTASGGRLAANLRVDQQRLQLSDVHNQRLRLAVRSASRYGCLQALRVAKPWIFLHSGHGACNKQYISRI